MKHPQTQYNSASARSATATLLAALIATGPVLAQAPAASTPNAANPSTAATAPAAIDPELIRQLLLRIEQLEQREAAHTNAVTDEVNRKLQQRIAELEQKLGAIESGGKVLPEIAVTPNDAPTTVELDRKQPDFDGARGVAGALIATVVGLFVAIPAMFAYNFMVTSIRAITQELDAFATEFATAVEHAHVDNRPIGEEITEANQVLATAITTANESLLARLTALLQPR